MHRQLFAALAFCSLAFTAFSGNSGTPGGVLRRLNFASFGDDAAITAMATDPDGNLIVTGTTSNLQTRNAAQPASLEAGVLRSDDLGKTWTRLGRPPEDVKGVVPDPVYPQILFAAGDKGIYKTVDAGQNWRKVYSWTGQFIGALTIDPGNHLRLAAASYYGPFVRSVDGGETWTTIAASPYHVAADPNGSGGLLAWDTSLSISRDWGVSFEKLSPPGGAITAASFSPMRPGWIYAATTAASAGTLSVSKDSGVTWTHTSSPARYTGFLYFAVDPNQPDTLVGMASDATYRSTDGGASWAKASALGVGISPYQPLPYAYVGRQCSAGGGLFVAQSHGPRFPTFAAQLAFSQDYGTTSGVPQLTYVTSMSMIGCSVYVTRGTTPQPFVAKLAADGSTLWATYLGGSDMDVPVALTVDSKGAVYVAGHTTSPDFPVDAPRIGPRGVSSVFVVKYAPGGAVSYSVLAGGSSGVMASALAADDGGNAYIIGSTDSTDLPTTPGVFKTALEITDPWSGFLTKLSPSASAVFTTYLGASATSIVIGPTGELVISGTGSAPFLASPNGAAHFVMELDSAAARMVGGVYLSGTGGGYGPFLAKDNSGNAVAMGSVYVYPPTAVVTPGAYTPPDFASGCMGIKTNYYGGTGLYVTKLRISDLKTVYGALLTMTCGPQYQPTMSVDAHGAVALGFATGGGLALRNPFLTGAACGINSGAVMRLSADGGSLDFASYLDACYSPVVASAPDGSLYAGAKHGYSGPTGVLRIPATTPSGISIDRISNAFSGDASAVAPGGLYAIEGTGFAPPTADLGLAPSRDLPAELNGVRVTFNGAPGSILRTGTGRVIVAAPPELPAEDAASPQNRSRRKVGAGFTAVRLIYNGVASEPVWAPVTKSLPGLMTKDGLTPMDDDGYATGAVRNQDGSVNDIDHPAPVGSTVTLMATGLGSAGPSFSPGTVAQAAGQPAATALYSTWTRATPGYYPPAETVTWVPGLVSAVFQIQVHVPSGVSGTDVGNGVKLAPVGVLFQPQLYVYPSVSNVVGVYVK